MEGKIFEIPLDIYSGVLTNQIRELVTEDMSTNTFKFKLVKNKHIPYTLTGTVVRMIVKTPSGARIQQECTVENASLGTIVITLKQSLILEPGSYVAELQIYDEITQNIRLTTPVFYYNVRESLQNSESIIATDEYTILQQALADLAGINIIVANKADKSDIGDISTLTTTDKTNLVKAINEVKSQSNQIATDVNEHKTDNMTQKEVHGLRYEEGTFTPILEFGGNSTGITYTSQLGRYRKIGKLVNIEIDIVLSSKGSATGASTIRGLPFSAAPSLPRRNLINGDMENITINRGDVDFAYSTSRLSPSAVAFAPGIYKKNGVYVSYTNTDFTDTTALRISGSYHTN